jgi:hypothetical protein
MNAAKRNALEMHTTMLILLSRLDRRSSAFIGG